MARSGPEAMLRWLLIGFVTTAGLALISNLIARFAAVRRKGQDVHRLTPSGPMLWTVLVMAFGISVVIWLSSYVRDYSGPLALAMCLAYIAIVAVLAVFLLFHHVFWTAEGIGSWDPWRKGRFVRWSEVRAIRRMRLIGIICVDDGMSAIIYSSFFSGAGALSAFLARRGVGGVR